MGLVFTAGGVRNLQAVARLEALDLATDGDGGQRLLPVAVELLEQRQLGAGLDLFAAHFATSRTAPVEFSELPRVLGQCGDRSEVPLAR